MWFKQTDPKSPQQAEPAHARPQNPTAQPPAPGAPPPAAPEPPRPAMAAQTPSAVPAISAQASRLTSGLSIKGDITGNEELWVGGNVEGTVRLSGARLTLGASGAVRGEMEAREIVIEGRVDGDLHATERIAITRSGQVKGDSAAPRVAIEDGAVYNGSIQVVREGEPRSAGRSASAPSHSGASQRAPRPASPQAAGAAAGSGAPSAHAAGIASSALAAGTESPTIIAAPPASESE